LAHFSEKKVNPVSIVFLNKEKEGRRHLHEKKNGHMPLSFRGEAHSIVEKEREGGARVAKPLPFGSGGKEKRGFGGIPIPRGGGSLFLEVEFKTTRCVCGCPGRGRGTSDYRKRGGGVSFHFSSIGGKKPLGVRT